MCGVWYFNIEGDCNKILGWKIFMMYNNDYCNNFYLCVICIDFFIYINVIEKYDWVCLDVYVMFDVKMLVYDVGNYSWCSWSVVYIKIKVVDFCIVWSCG